MHADVIERLLRINREFYQSHAAAFAETRARLQPGVVRIVQRIRPAEDVLDAGCGTGSVAAALRAAGHLGRYLGIDSSPSLLQHARSHEAPPRVRFEARDLALDPLEDLAGSGFDWGLAFAVLHHLPGDALRERVVRRLAGCLAPGGRLVVSVWAFLNSARLRDRILPWSTVGLAPAEVEPGDSLLDWRRGGQGLRYVHAFGPEELDGLARRAGLAVVETFASDGQGGRLGLYQVWEKADPSSSF
jgi:SAM-dependent methyltransferase